MLLLASLCYADTQISAAPSIVKYKVRPAVLQQNKTINASVKFKFNDPDQNLYGGVLRILVIRQSGGKTKFEFPLSENRFKQADGGALDRKSVV